MFQKVLKIIKFQVSINKTGVNTTLWWLLSEVDPGFILGGPILQKTTFF